MNFVRLGDGPFHVYTEAPGTTLCGEAVRDREAGWATTGSPVDSPHFPLELCESCKALVLEGREKEA